MSSVEIEPTWGCRICDQADGSDTLTAYVLCLEHRHVTNAAPALLAALKSILADLDRDMPMDCPVDPETFTQAETAIAQAEGSE